jgi:1-acyl-sn-glycerol-3-phosphate acyltransferase
MTLRPCKSPIIVNKRGKIGRMTVASPSSGPNTPLTQKNKPIISLGDVIRAPFKHSPGFLSTLSVKLCAALGSRTLVKVDGIENLQGENDPFIVVLNHNQKLEALSVPGLLMYLRDGKMIHFLADWNFCLVPGVWLFYHYGQVITIARKPAKPRFLNVFKPLFTSRESGFSQAQKALAEGRSVGIFPEGTTNRHPTELLKGFSGVAQLSLNANAAVLPIGIQFPEHDQTKPIPEHIPMALNIGRPMRPQPIEGKPKLEEIRAWHRQIMTAIADLSGKSWQPQNRRK